MGENGFATLAIQNKEEQKIIEDVFEHIGGFTSFRFPPIEEKVVYTDEIRAVFRLFFRLAVDVLEQLLRSVNTTIDVERIRLQCQATKTMTLFSEPRQ